MRIREFRNVCVELMVAGNLSMSIPEFTEAGVPGGVCFFLIRGRHIDANSGFAIRFQFHSYGIDSIFLPWHLLWL